MALGEEREPHDRLRVGLDLGDDRLVRVLGQTRAHPRHAVAHVVRRRVDVALSDELDRDLAHLLARHRLQGLHALDARKRVLQRLRDLRLDDLRARALVDRAHRNHRGVDLRVLAHRQAIERDHADEHDHQAHHRREDRALDADFGEAHGGALDSQTSAVCNSLSRPLCKTHSSPDFGRLGQASDHMCCVVQMAKSSKVGRPINIQNPRRVRRKRESLSLYPFFPGTSAFGLGGAPPPITATAAPGRRRWLPSVTTRSPAAMPVDDLDLADLARAGAHADLLGLAVDDAEHVAVATARHDGLPPESTPPARARRAAG